MVAWGKVLLISLFPVTLKINNVESHQVSSSESNFKNGMKISSLSCCMLREYNFLNAVTVPAWQTPGLGHMAQI
jgi:hypothetical protein